MKTADSKAKIVQSVKLPSRMWLGLSDEQGKRKHAGIIVPLGEIAGEIWDFYQLHKGSASAETNPLVTALLDLLERPDDPKRKTVVRCLEGHLKAMGEKTHEETADASPVDPKRIRRA